jgi:hypothetical protein
LLITPSKLMPSFFAQYPLWFVSIVEKSKLQTASVTSFVFFYCWRNKRWLRIRSPL